MHAGEGSELRDEEHERLSGCAAPNAVPFPPPLPLLHPGPRQVLHEAFNEARSPAELHAPELPEAEVVQALPDPRVDTPLVPVGPVRGAETDNLLKDELPHRFHPSSAAAFPSLLKGPLQTPRQAPGEAAGLAPVRVEVDLKEGIRYGEHGQPCLPLHRRAPPLAGEREQHIVERAHQGPQEPQSRVQEEGGGLAKETADVQEEECRRPAGDRTLLSANGAKRPVLRSLRGTPKGPHVFGNLRR